MSTTLKICRKELFTYVTSPALYVFLVVFVGLAGGLLFYASPFFSIGSADLGPHFFEILPYLLLIFSPAIAMRLWAEENKSGTIELLMTLPVRDWEAVVGKFLAGYLMVLLALALTLPVPYLVAGIASSDAPFDFGPVWSGYIGVCLMGAVFLSIANAVSATTKNQIIAFIVGLSLCFVVFFIGRPVIVNALPETLQPFFTYIGVGAHIATFRQGAPDTRAILYFVSFTLFTLFLTVRVIESRRWR